MAEPSSTSDRRWTAAAWTALAAGLLLACLLGFVVVPAMRAQSLGLDPWTAICRAVGLRPAALRDAGAAVAPGGMPVSAVSWDPRLLFVLAHADRRKGAALAASTCSACHGEEGVSQDPSFPLLAEQSAAAIYKQLADYRRGARADPTMSVIAQQLSQRQMVDLAGYFAHDRAFHALGVRWPNPDAAAQTLAVRGDPARNLPACDACHGKAAGGPTETPTLAGQQQEYILRQLQLYASGERRNDVYGRMRAVAKKLTPDEAARLAAYYQGVE